MPRILLVDDDESFRKMLRIKLTNMGHAVTEVRNGIEALKMFEVEHPEVVMTDIIMPEKEGLETIRELRHKHPAAKIVAMSGGGRVSATDYLKIAKAMGANLTLSKPFSNQELEMALAKIGERKPGAISP
jgi:CheY-like chemotaxis protein